MVVTTSLANMRPWNTVVLSRSGNVGVLAGSRRYKCFTWDTRRCVKEPKFCGGTGRRGRVVPECWLGVVSGRSWGGGRAGAPHQALLGYLLGTVLQQGGCTRPADSPHPQRCWNWAPEDSGTNYQTYSVSKPPFTNICERCTFFVSLIIICPHVLAFFLPPLVPLFLPSFLPGWFGRWQEVARKYLPLFLLPVHFLVQNLFCWRCSDLLY